MMVADHHDPDAIKTLFEKDMIGKLPEITPPIPGRIKVLSLWMTENLINRLVEFSPKTVRKLPGNLRVIRLNFPCLPRCQRVKNEFHRSAISGRKLG